MKPPNIKICEPAIYIHPALAIISLSGSEI